MSEKIYDDVPDGAWYTEYVNTAYKAGIMTGDGNGMFRPHDPLKRKEAAKIVALLLEKIQEK